MPIARVAVATVAVGFDAQYWLIAKLIWELFTVPLPAMAAARARPVAHSLASSKAFELDSDAQEMVPGSIGTVNGALIGIGLALDCGAA